ncbi:hypothetical protein J6590_023520 [Homalodisca vitripennis]|nr:hypothetical protein J6590_023520 [Homalodisca vitripennis]
MSPGSGSRSSASNSGSTSSTDADSGQGARPRAGSDSSTHSSASRNPVSKMMDLFRHRSHSAVSADEKRKAHTLTAKRCVRDVTLSRYFSQVATAIWW